MWQGNLPSLRLSRRRKAPACGEDVVWELAPSADSPRRAGRTGRACGDGGSRPGLVRGDGCFKRWEDRRAGVAAGVAGRRRAQSCLPRAPVRGHYEHRGA